jgi:hypothetical protein
VDLGIDLHAGDEARSKKGQPTLSLHEVSERSRLAQSLAIRTVLHPVGPSAILSRLDLGCSGGSRNPDKRP